jgi:orotidine-5'-phosphate decarboxylase
MKEVMKDKIITALDVSSSQEALHLANELGDLSGMFKVGSQLFMAAGPSIVEEIVRTGARVFLDLKFHDIPNTVTHAVMEAATRGVSMMTVHASGGRRMMESVALELKNRFGSVRPAVVAVTVLTSLDNTTLRQIGVEDSLEVQVHRLALLAQECGLSGVVCSPREISMLRKVVRPDFKLVVPGIRMPDQPLHDQQRIAAPHDAINAGADHIVVGRAVTAEADPRGAMLKLLASFEK